MLLGLGRIGGRGLVGGIDGVEVGFFFGGGRDEGELRGLVGFRVWDMCMVR